jgi:protoporphyrin/coproporphyrin ferrochelatase
MSMKTAVVLFNLGGPDNLKAVKPFLFNLFNDRAILTMPQPLRYLLAKLISGRRASKARAIYQHMGGKSPLLDHTQAQADALEQKLRENGDYKVFVCMRYWHPMSDIVAKNVNAYKPDRIILLPLYPQYSTTTTGSSFANWDEAAKKAGISVPTAKICCYPAGHGFVAAHVKQIKDTYWKAAEEGQPRILFSAHGLPEKIIKAGDPYQWQVEKTVAAITQILTIDGLDYATCYQSRVGKLPWIGPSTEEEIVRAGKDKVPVVVVPVAFVSEHSETLVELDIEYRRLAEKENVPGYWRVPALGTDPYFIEELADLCLSTTKDPDPRVASFTKQQYCSSDLKQCPCAAKAA